jgi:CRP/FNR family transcriptional regulator, cyclic AMP receptor protein
MSDNAATAREPAADAAHSPSSMSVAMRAVAAQGIERRYKRGTILIAEGEPGAALYFIESGLLRSYSERADGQQFTFGLHGPGDYIGEFSLDGGPRSASVLVEQPALCRVVQRDLLERAIAAEPKLAFELLAHVIKRVRDLSARARDLALSDAYGRLALWLRESSLPLPDGTRRVTQALTQAQLAQTLGCSRPMVTRLLGDLVKGGYLQHDDGHWRLMRALPARW